MKLHHLLDDIFGSKSKVKILRLMFRYQEREFTEREIARHISMSQNTVNKALADLTKTNALSFRKIGRANAYIVNKNSVLFPFLQNIFKSERRIREDLIKRLKEATGHFTSCILFGSFAQSAESYDSDLDLLVIAKDKRKAKYRLDKLEDDLLRKYNISISIVLLTPRELLNKWNTPYMKEARKTNVVISGKSLGELYGESSKN
jgi:predicted nucleotidyltransferase